MPTQEVAAVAEVKPDECPAKDQGQGGRFAMLNTFVDHVMATIPRTDALVWLVLYRDVHGETARTAQAYIASRAGVSKRTVHASIGRLTRAGFLDVAYQGGLNRGISIYRLRPLAQDQQSRILHAPHRSKPEHSSVQSTCVLPRSNP